MTTFIYLFLFFVNYSKVQKHTFILLIHSSNNCSCCFLCLIMGFLITDSEPISVVYWYNTATHIIFLSDNFFLSYHTTCGYLNFLLLVLQLYLVVRKITQMKRAIYFHLIFFYGYCAASFRSSLSDYSR